MSDHPPLPRHLTVEYSIAEKVRQRLSVFPLKFKELGAGGELRSLVRSTRTLSGPVVEQAPEDFTEQYLIEPVLDGLGYLNPTTDGFNASDPHFVRRPTTFSKVEPRRPDYLLKNVDDSLVCLLEAKAANNELMSGKKRKATAGVKKYLESNTFCHSLSQLKYEFLVGIGTDGLRWTLWVKDLGSGELKTEIVKINLADVIEEIAMQEQVIEGESDGKNSRVMAREKLYEEFIPPFAAQYLPTFVRELDRDE